VQPLCHARPLSGSFFHFFPGFTLVTGFPKPRSSFFFFLPKPPVNFQVGTFLSSFFFLPLKVGGTSGTCPPFFRRGEPTSSHSPGYFWPQSSPYLNLEEIFFSPPSNGFLFGPYLLGNRLPSFTAFSPDMAEPLFCPFELQQLNPPPFPVSMILPFSVVLLVTFSPEKVRRRTSLPLC